MRPCRAGSEFLGEIADTQQRVSAPIRPTVFYRWLKQLFENGAAAFGLVPRADKQVEALERERFAELVLS